MLLRLLRPTFGAFRNSFHPLNQLWYSTNVKLEDHSTLKEYMSEVLNENSKSRKPIVWADLKLNLVQTLPTFTKESALLKLNNVESFLAVVIANERNTIVMLDFLQFVEKNGHSLPILAYKNILKCLTNGSFEDLNAEQKQQISQICEKILDGKVLVVTDQIKLEIAAIYSKLGKTTRSDLIKDDVKVIPDDKASNSVYKQMILSALNQDQMDKFWNQLDSKEFHYCVFQSIEKASSISVKSLDEVYIAYLKKFRNNHEMLEKLFKYFKKYCIVIRPTVQEAFQDLDLDLAITDRRALCYNCKQRIPPHSIAKEDCQTIIKAFIDDFLSKDMYKWSFPTEFKSFKDFLERDLNPNYDVVVDGLNVAFSGSKRAHWQDRRMWTGHDKLLIQCLRTLKDKGFKNILLIHRTWLKKSKDYLLIKDLCSSHILLDRNTHDDPFAIISALHFGPGTLLVSNDDFRHYFSLLDDERVKSLLLKWCFQHTVRHQSHHQRGFADVSLLLKVFDSGALSSQQGLKI